MQGWVASQECTRPAAALPAAINQQAACLGVVGGPEVGGDGCQRTVQQPSGLRIQPSDGGGQLQREAGQARSRTGCSTATVPYTWQQQTNDSRMRDCTAATAPTTPLTREHCHPKPHTTHLLCHLQALPQLLHRLGALRAQPERLRILAVLLCLPAGPGKAVQCGSAGSRPWQRIEAASLAQAAAQVWLAGP